MNWVNDVLDFIFPATCSHCKAFCVHPEPLCAVCLAFFHQCEIPLCELPGFTQESREVYASWYYRAESPVRSIHRLLKYNSSERMGAWLGSSMMLRTDWKVDFCIPVPSHRSRVLERGMLHTLELARAFCPRHQISIKTNVLVRRRLTLSQSRLTGEARKDNVNDVFHIPPAQRASVKGAQILLLDDVMTTGATLDAAARTLEAVGARVHLVVAALRRESFNPRSRLSDSPRHQS